MMRYFVAYARWQRTKLSWAIITDVVPLVNASADANEGEVGKFEVMSGMGGYA